MQATWYIYQNILTNRKRGTFSCYEISKNKHSKILRYTSFEIVLKSSASAQVVCFFFKRFNNLLSLLTTFCFHFLASIGDNSEWKFALFVSQHYERFEIGFNLTSAG